MSVEPKAVTKASAMRGKIVKSLRDIRGELKKVIWPTRKQLINNTITVLVGCLLIGIFIWVGDLIFSKISSLVFTR